MGEAPIDRRQLQARTGLAWATVCQAVESLEALGLIRPAGHGPSKGGRPPLDYELDPDRRTLIGLDYELSTLTLRVSNLAGESYHEERVSVEHGQDLRAAGAQILQLVQRLGKRKELLERSEQPPRGPLAFGLGVPALVFMHEQGKPVVYSSIQFFEQQGLLQKIHDLLGLPVYAGGNIHALALAEGWFGAARGRSSYAYLSFRTGVGMALVLNGRVVTGAHHLAGELGQFSMDPVGPRSPHGKPGCLGQYAAGGPMLERARSLGWSAPHGAATPLAAFVDAALAGAEVPNRLLGEAATMAGRAAAEVAHLFDPERLVMGGSLAAARALTEKPLREAFAAYAMPPHAAQVELVFSELADGGALGAAALALEGLMTG
ncbi:MAG: ROK family protein [Planctomycetota bacterium]|nr:ROK family protein [Planctomycetota bacterium]